MGEATSVFMSMSRVRDSGGKKSERPHVIIGRDIFIYLFLTWKTTQRDNMNHRFNREKDESGLPTRSMVFHETGTEIAAGCLFIFIPEHG